ncbi:MAG: alpha/beta hydrolase [Dehalococcoidia bacterium]
MLQFGVPNQADYSLLDRPEILQLVFYPRMGWQPPPPRATDHWVPVAEGISVSCRLYPAGESSPNILFFHGNGEIVTDYDWLAPEYNRLGISLFVAGYRGYGLSGGRPTFSTMVADAHAIFNYLGHALRPRHSGPLLVMGRSLGSYSALELASHYPEQLAGLIVESGIANPGRLLSLLGGDIPASRLEDLERANLERLRSISLPVLIIHGERDELIPYSQAVDFHRNVGSGAKRLVAIPGAGHNDLLFLGREQYFSAIEGFVLGSQLTPSA